MKDSIVKKTRRSVNKKSIRSVTNTFPLNKQIRSFTIQFGKETFFERICNTMTNECLSTMSSCNIKNGINVTEEIQPFNRNRVSKKSAMNVTRDVPLRQYYGKYDKTSKKTFVYGVNNGSKTVGIGDQWRTRKVSEHMNQMMNFLSQKVKELPEYDGMCKDLSLNHCTVLYYICDVATCKTDIDITKSKSNLNWHCDVKHNASSGVKAHGGQCADSPTVVVTLCDSRKLDFGKRWHDRKFKTVELIDTSILNHKDVFVLHSKDEEIDVRSGDKKQSQFQHRVIANKPSTVGKPYLSIALVFRQVSNTMMLTIDGMQFGAQTPTKFESTKEERDKISEKFKQIANIKREQYIN
jgi:hypothetical protein